ncbi:MAG TPA: HEAT repeat domain-containing protein [Ignavibacteriaceae bacterium]|nr:HEAT repeat domain-containing protein [Ignavibacteriaceae bacterium]
MNTQKNKIAKLAALILLAALISNNMFAKNLLSCNVTDLKDDISEKMIKNLAAGIESDNLGLRKSCIYFAGLYEIDELVQPLIKQLQKEKDANTRILIALALSKIGNEAGIKAIVKLAKNDPNPKVKRIGYALVNYFNSNTSDAENVNLTQK